MVQPRLVTNAGATRYPWLMCCSGTCSAEGCTDGVKVAWSEGEKVPGANGEGHLRFPLRTPPPFSPPPLTFSLSLTSRRGTVFPLTPSLHSSISLRHPSLHSSISLRHPSLHSSISQPMLFFSCPPLAPLPPLTSITVSHWRCCVCVGDSTGVCVCRCL